MPHPLPFTSPTLLAPMDGITEPAFRDIVLERHDPADLGGAFTEFVRITDAPMTRRRLRDHLGRRRFSIPVGLQLMGNNVDAMAKTAWRAVDAGAPVVDINFGCPAKGAQRTCAGSALLDDPATMDRLIRACVAAIPDTPVTAKIRAGVRDDTRLEEVAHVVEEAGASLLTVHCRTREEGYREEAIDWERIARVVEVVDIPVCGNGGVTRYDEIDRMRRETGCAYVMIGRGALANPWVFSGREVDTVEAARFLVDYRDVMLDNTKGEHGIALARIKQLMRYWTAGDLGVADRMQWMRERDPAVIWERLERLVATSPARQCVNPPGSVALGEGGWQNRRGMSGESSP